MLLFMLTFSIKLPSCPTAASHSFPRHL